MARLVLATALIALAGILPARAETAAAYMQRVANDLVAASRTGSPTEFATALRSHADVPSIGLTALGSYAASLPKSDRPNYFNGMINFIARYAAKESPKYPVAKAIVVGASEETASGAYVDTSVTLKTGETYDIRFQLVRRGGTYKVREAEYMGFPMSSSLNSLFQNYIAENGGNPKVLIMALNR